MTAPVRDGEGRRQAYLAALGIPLWSSRQALPGALPGASLTFVPFLVEVGAQPAAAPVMAAFAEVAPLPAAAAPVAQSQASPEERPQAAPAAVVPRPVAPAGDSRFPRFNCRVRPLSAGWTAVIALDDAPDLAALEYRLLDNIAQALGAEELPAASGEALRWPLNRNPALDHGHDAMRAWLRHALRLPPGRCVVFGEELAGHVRAALPDREVLAAPALGELIASASAKRRLSENLMSALHQNRDD